MNDLETDLQVFLVEAIRYQDGQVAFAKDGDAIRKLAAQSIENAQATARKFLERHRRKRLRRAALKNPIQLRR